jgi:transcriptional regulator with GAF, ATPase, and Fis domain
VIAVHRRRGDGSATGSSFRTGPSRGTVGDSLQAESASRGGQQYEKQLVVKALKLAGRRIAEAARHLGLTQRTLLRLDTASSRPPI